MTSHLTFRRADGLAYFVLIWSLLMLAGAWAVDETKGWFNSLAPSIKPIVCHRYIFIPTMRNPLLDLPYCQTPARQGWYGPRQQPPTTTIKIQAVRLQGPKNCSGIKNRRRPRVFHDRGCKSESRRPDNYPSNLAPTKCKY